MLRSTSERRVAIGSGFTMALTPPGAVSRPEDLPAGLDWTPASVPGTAARSLELAGRWSRDDPISLHELDIWYRCRLEERGERMLVLNGLATLAEVWLDDRLILRSESMFERHRLPVRLAGGETLHLCFRALAPDLRRRPGRGRWPAPMIETPAIRHRRSTLLGHMPGWCPRFGVVGPWRAVELIERTGPLELLDLRLRADRVDGRARLEVELAARWATGRLPQAELRLGELRYQLDRSCDHGLRAAIDLPEIAPWWPWTHGEPALHGLSIHMASERLELGRVGFRELALDHGPDGRGFGFRVNGVPVFARGANWMPVDPVGLDGSRPVVGPCLKLLREAGSNMVRVPGCTVYEDEAFHELCDELGILVWQDLMLANLDYPIDDATWRAALLAEAADLLDRTARHPSLALLCGGSEIAQQAAMTGQWAKAERRWHDLAGELAALVADRRPGLPFLPHTPWGGPLPFVVAEGPSHAYGVGAYLRRLAEARAAAPRFAAECLALANVPEASSLERIVPDDVGVGHDPRWKALVPRDRGASWDFEDVRDHYLEQLFGVAARTLRRADPERWLELSRIVSVELFRRVLAEWRRPGSPCRGALVWHSHDLSPGIGFGVVDGLGRPKPAWHGMAQVLQPLQLFLTDEGLDGLAVHLLNDGPASRRVRLELICLREGAVPVARGARDLGVEAHGSATLSAWSLLPAFLDLTHAYRFGPPQLDAVVARVSDPESGDLLDESVHLPMGLEPWRRDPDLSVAVERDARGWLLRLRCRRLARFVRIDDAAFRAVPSWFHLSPDRERTVRLEPLWPQPDLLPDGLVRSLDCPAPRAYRAVMADPP